MDWIIAGKQAERVFSIEKVGDEIAAGADELSEWADEQKDLFLQPGADIFPALGTVSAWATSQNYEPTAINTFLQVADYYLVAHALAQAHVVVTHEIAAATTKKIKIPNACIGLSIKFMTPYEMLRTERARFVLGQA